MKRLVAIVALGTGLAVAAAGITAAPLAAAAGPAAAAPAAAGSGGAAAGSAGSAAGPAPVAADPATVRTDSGPVRGTVTTENRSFQGIPYAAPPKDALRWAPPRPVAPWTAPRDATRPGSACPQTGDFIGDEPSDTEDCLYLNVTTPRGGNRALPVMVWIHGGGFYSGSADVYDAARLANQGRVVVVSVNYRLGVFGFLAHPALPDGGNFGLADQQAALRWVQRNAAAFGGDPGNVTVFGESAGGVSTCAHLAAPSSAGLFHRAIIQSGPCALTTQWPYAGGTWVARPRADAERIGTELASTLGCGDVACLRGASVAALLEASHGGYDYGPVVGGGILPVNPAQALATGRFNRVPVMQGTTRDEHRTFTAAFELMSGQPVTEAGYRQEVEAFFGPEKAKRVLARYPVRDYGSPSLALAAIWTDYSWACPALDTDRMLARHVPTYAYEFADQDAPWFADAPEVSFPTGAYHAAELQYLFPGVYGADSLPPAQRRLSDRMIRYWAGFAHGTPPWRPFTTGSEHVTALTPGNAMGTVDLGRVHRCGFWQ